MFIAAIEIKKTSHQLFPLQILGFLLVVVNLIVGCASAPEEPVTKAHRATSSMDLFQVEQGMPLREVQKQEFYFKHCELETRRAFTNKAEFFCNEK